MKNLRNRQENFAVKENCHTFAVHFGDVLVLTASMPDGKHAGPEEISPLIWVSKKLVGNNNYALAA